MGLRIEQFGERKICIGGVGTMFHQEGFPIGMAAKELNEKGIELSWLHVAKELYFQYTSNERLFNKLQSEVEDAKIEGIECDLVKLRQFCFGDWECQRELIFDFLFGNDTNKAREFFKQKVA